ncbi:MAG TPA: hypothetical protein VEX69_01805 [Candidatus Limnocylindria bacterium]|nr:hypothetical protein [Candidatus Limnocylindria bacterium]
MDCAKFENIVHDLDRPGTPGAAQCESALAHAESCHSCATLLTQVEWLEFSLLKLSEISAGRQPSPHLEAVVLREFRRTKELAARTQIRWRLAALATAAALFLALGLALRHRSSPSPAPVPDVAAKSQHEAPLLGSAPVAPVATPLIAHHSPTPSQVNDVDEPDNTADATTFIRLPYADDSATLDGGAIVRVELSRSALASFGLPVADTGDAQRILADLVVSTDGTPEAIRLVSEVNPSQEF